LCFPFESIANFKTVAIVAAMLTPHQRRDLLRIEQSRDAAAITAAINQVLTDNPDTDLLEIEMTLRAAASTAFVIATAEGFVVVVGMKNWVAALDAFGRTPEVNRQLLAAGGNPNRWGARVRTWVIALNVISSLTCLAMAGLGWIVTMVARIPVPEQQDYRVIAYGLVLIATFLIIPVICVTASTRLARQNRRSSVLVALAPAVLGAAAVGYFVWAGTYVPIR
jgi:hypothetical protein